ncbi:hypothetical protein GALMADRAFT_412428 [Galerina marginata CBS 339.88]|uniref:Uncharacterized protein n=1 Tax=Galerina marginata (strain CBS 339.88) TaxID=685588 RepID=A0A067TFI9_GALM3|nr:hypothetical protein GALMADRAFT_412428 [Galerina marginata CBS 339.88]
MPLVDNRLRRFRASHDNPQTAPRLNRFVITGRGSYMQPESEDLGPTLVARPSLLAWPSVTLISGVEVIDVRPLVVSFYQSLRYLNLKSSPVVIVALLIWKHVAPGFREAYTDIQRSQIQGWHLSRRSCAASFETQDIIISERVIRIRRRRHILHHYTHTCVLPTLAFRIFASSAWGILRAAGNSASWRKGKWVMSDEATRVCF